MPLVQLELCYAHVVAPEVVVRYSVHVRQGAEAAWHERLEISPTMCCH